MNIFNCRSPKIIDIDGDSHQTSTELKIEIFDFDDNLLLSKIISKLAFSPDNYINYYNISPFIYDILNTLETSLAAVKVNITPYYYLGSTIYHLDTFEFIGVNGYNNYNTTLLPIIGKYYILYNNFYKNKSINYNRNNIDGDFEEKNIPTIDVIFDFNGNHDEYVITYNSNSYITNITITNNDKYYYARIPMSIDNAHYENNNSFTISRLDLDEYVPLFSINLFNLCEPKYTPLNLKYINRKGGLQNLTLFKNSTQNIEVKGSEYNTNTFISYPEYNQSLGQKRIFNKNGTKTIKCNTGWIEENEKENILDIMLSENLLLSYYELIDYSGIQEKLVEYAVTLKNSSMLMKTHLNEKVINYELEFEVASALINNVV